MAGFDSTADTPSGRICTNLLPVHAIAFRLASALAEAVSAGVVAQSGESPNRRSALRWQIFFRSIWLSGALSMNSITHWLALAIPPARRLRAAGLP